MKKYSSARWAVTAVLSCVLLAPNDAEACSNVLVTKGASADGSCMVTYSADSHQLYGELYYKPAADWKSGAMLEVRNWDEGHLMGYIPQAAHTYQTVGNMNQHQLIITETTFGGRHELEDGKGIVDYGSLIYITLQRARTAREAIKVMDELVQNYGYPSAGESFSIADTEEVWIMEMVSKGEGKGAVWVARRVPDGYICAHANQARIDRFPLDDPQNCLYSPDVITFAREKGWFDGTDSEFSFCDTYCPIDFSGARACEARAWAAFNILCDGRFCWEDETGSHEAAAADWLDFAMGHNLSHKMPLFVKPARKVTVSALADVMRDHFEGTPMDMTEDVGAGCCRTPYRWRPMSFELDGKEYVHERAIATQQTGFWLLGQARGNYPDEMGGILWFGVDDAATSALTPIYTNITAIPECFRVGNGSMTEYSPTAAFWQFNKVTHFAYLFYDRVAPVIQKHIKDYEQTCFEAVAKTDAELETLLAKGNVKKAVKLMNNTVNGLATGLMERWKGLENQLLVTFMDGNVKAMNEDGTFKLRNPEGSAVPASPGHPAQRERWLRAIVEDHGETLLSR
ncbi:MAG: C69 family dipeptidase [Bacteroidales bacterium]|nr:C69 family dipeptidase [Bacteroidales bacterium]